MRSSEKLKPFKETARLKRQRRDQDLIDNIDFLRERISIEMRDALELAARDTKVRQRIAERWQVMQYVLDDISCSAMAVSYACRDGDPKAKVRVAEFENYSVAQKTLEPLSDPWKRMLQGFLDQTYEAATSEIVFARNDMPSLARKAAKQKISMIKAFEAILDTARPEQKESAADDDASDQDHPPAKAQAGADDGQY